MRLALSLEPPTVTIGVAPVHPGGTGAVRFSHYAGARSGVHPLNTGDIGAGAGRLAPDAGRAPRAASEDAGVGTAAPVSHDAVAQDDVVPVHACPAGRVGLAVDPVLAAALHANP